MANNVTVTPGTGDTVAAEDVSSVKYQLVKLVDATAASTTRTGVAANPLQVSLANHGANATAVKVDLSTDNDVLVTGNAAHDAADSGNPVKIGARAENALSGATLVADADRVDAVADLDGALLVRGDRALGDLTSGNASNTDGTSTSLIAAAGSGIKTYITDITITNTSASNTYVELKDGSTAKYTFPVPANSGVTHSFSSPLGGTANTAWNFDPATAITTIYCSASGFKSKI